MVYTEDSQLPDVAANQLGKSDRGVEHLHHGGTVYLAINSECNWQVSAWQLESAAIPSPASAVVRKLIESVMGAGMVTDVKINEKARTLTGTVKDVLVKSGQALEERGRT